MNRNLTLVSLIQNGDKQAEEDLCIENLSLVKSIASRFVNCGTDENDLIQIGTFALWKAAKAFDLSRGLQFSTYAVPVIAGEIKRYLRDDGIIKISRTLKERKLRAKSAEEALRRKLYREPSISEIAQECNITITELTEALDACMPVESIEDKTDVYEKAYKSDENKLINKIFTEELLNSLSKRERLVIYMRYTCEKTQSEIAKKLGVSQVHISRIEKNAIVKMRDFASKQSQHNP